MSKQFTILIVDDDEDFVHELKCNLQKENYITYIANSNKNAQTHLQTITPDIILLGTLCPRGSSFQLQKWIKTKAILKDIPLIVIDVFSGDQLVKGWRRDEGMTMDAVDYLQKPIEASALSDIIKQSLIKKISQIRVLIADDHAVVREGLKALLQLQQNITVVGEAADGKDAVEKTLELMPDIVLMDILMPHMTGIEATKNIMNHTNQTKVVILSQYDDEKHQITGKEAGASSFISKRNASSQLIDTIKAVVGA